MSSRRSGSNTLRESFQRLAPYIPFDLMRFRLTYDGPLVASGRNSPGRNKEKWAIREQIRPQLKG